jgi:hypothetical protein
MIPATIHDSVPSAAERRLFETIRDAPNTDHWVCLHSLALAHHDTKRRAEIDFVLLTRHGIFVLECKGGRLRRQRGVWYSIDKEDVRHKLSESPFDQASSAMFALQRRIRAQFKNEPYGDPLFGYGVLTPDFDFDLESPEFDRKQVYDLRDTAHDFTRYINRLAEYSRAAEARDKRPALKPEAIDAIAHYLRGDFDFIPSANALIDNVRHQLDELTQEQRIVLDVLQDSERVLVDGGAGTGKTLLAIEAAQRMARAGQRVLFLCYNKLLAARLEARLANRSYEGELVVRHLDRLFFEAVEATEWESTVVAAIKRDKDTAFAQVLPEYAALVASDRPDQRFDVLIVDEAQDILTSANLVALNETLRGGLENGRWCFFLDGREQAKVYGRLNGEALARLTALGVRERLTLNCRNTRPIARQTAVVSNSQRRIKARVDGRPVGYHAYHGRSGWLKPLERIIAGLRKDNVPPGRISVLFPKTPHNELQQLERMGLRRLAETDVSQLGGEHLQDITWSVVSGFKGLENDVVILAAVTDIERDWHRGVAYVGMSRARTRLDVVIHEACDGKRREREGEWTARVDSDVEMLL